MPNVMSTSPRDVHSTRLSPRSWASSPCCSCSMLCQAHAAVPTGPVKKVDATLKMAQPLSRSSSQRRSPLDWDWRSACSTSVWALLMNNVVSRSPDAREGCDATRSFHLAALQYQAGHGRHPLLFPFDKS